jgi:hypothetical protein
VPGGIIGHLTREWGKTCTTGASSMARVGHSESRPVGPVHTRGHFTAIPSMPQRILLIWTLTYVSVQLIGAVQ